MADAKEAYDEGLKIRREMWGEGGADKRIADASAFNRPFEDIVTRQCFGEIWTRPHLDHKTRSMLTIAILATLSRPNQLRSHVMGGIANGLTPDEIREILIHVAAYAGIPAGADAFTHARDALKQMGLD